MYTPVPSGTPVSEFLEKLEANHLEIMSMQRGSTSPTVKPTGSLWFDSGNDLIKQWDGSAFRSILSPYTMHLAADGSVELTDDLDADGNKIVGLAAATANGQAVRFEQASMSDGTRLAYGVGLAHYNEACQVQQFDDQADTFEPCGLDGSLGGRDFVPRELRLRLSGNVTNQSDATLLGTMNEDLTVNRWNFGINDGTITVKSVTVGAFTVDVIVQWKYTAASGLGFYLRLVRQDDPDEWCDVVRAMCWATGINELITYPYV